MGVGDIVRILPPFNPPSDHFDGMRQIVRIEGDVYFLEGIEGGFDAMYLEAVNGN